MVNPEKMHTSNIMHPKHSVFIHLGIYTYINRKINKNEVIRLKEMCVVSSCLQEECPNSWHLHITSGRNPPHLHPLQLLLLLLLFFLPILVFESKYHFINQIVMFTPDFWTSVNCRYVSSNIVHQIILQ